MKIIIINTLKNIISSGILENHWKKIKKEYRKLNIKYREINRNKLNRIKSRKKRKKWNGRRIEIWSDW